MPKNILKKIKLPREYTLKNPLGYGVFSNLACERKSDVNCESADKTVKAKLKTLADLVNKKISDKVRITMTMTYLHLTSVANPDMIFVGLWIRI